MKKNDLIIFIGDSITEWGRYDDVEELGTGYVRLVHDYLVTAYPDRKPQVLNKGIGGHRINDLEKRWTEDVVLLNPAYVSISIGINDVWRQFDDADGVQIYPDQFERIYRDLLVRVTEETTAKIIMMEPTVIKEDLESEGNKVLQGYVEIVRKLANEFDAILVPLHHEFTSYLKVNNGYPLTIDGVHMNSAGNMLMAQAWIKACKNVLS
jgi:acyl-CoA thioesterase-1